MHDRKHRIEIFFRSASVWRSPLGDSPADLGYSQGQGEQVIKEHSV
jgi:hypothetical protein